MVIETFKYDDLQIEISKDKQPRPNPDNFGFGQNYSDHMFEAKWSANTGWKSPQIVPMHEIRIHPAAKVLHYAIEVFEGMKAFRGQDGKVRLFRPMMNMDRLVKSTERATLPEFDGKELLKCLKKLICIDRDCVPYPTNGSLYIRIAMIGTEPSLAMSRSKEALLFVITGPVAPYYPTGQPVSLLADPKYVRTWKGGCGALKLGANYAPTVHVQQEAMQKHNCQQVLWLCGKERYITEVGTMNFFLYWINKKGDNELLTPPLSHGIILPGVTRHSILELAKKWGTIKVSEKPVMMDELIEALQDNKVMEVFGGGAACNICIIGRIRFGKKTLQLPVNKDPKSVGMRLFKELTDIQHGVTPSDWTEDVAAIDDGDGDDEREEETRAESRLSLSYM